MAKAARVTDLETYPEADRFGVFPHPRHTRRLIGHADQAQELAQAISSGRSHHAWLMTGPQGIGKATLAWFAARFALAAPQDRRPDPAGAALCVDEAASAGHLVQALSHPGLILIRRPYEPKDKRFKTVITVDEVRRLRNFMGHTTGEQAWRVVLVDSVDEMNLAAANALLKSLEEPPPRTLFFLVCAEPGRVLATIKSRCRQLPLAALTHQQVDTAARAAIQDCAEALTAPDEPVWSQIMADSSGSVRRALSFVQIGGSAVLDQVDAVLSRLPQVDWVQAQRLADDLAAPGHADRFDLFFEVLLERMALIARAACGAGDPPANAGPLAARLRRPGALASWAELWETLGRDKAAVDALNLDRRSLILDTFARLARVPDDRAV